MASKPFDYAAPVKGLIPAKILNRWPAPSRGQCTVNGREICVQDNLAQTLLWYDKTLMRKFGYTVPTTWHQWAARPEGREGAPGLHHRTLGRQHSHWTYLWAGQCRSARCRRTAASASTRRILSHPDGQLLDPLIKNGTTPPENIFTPAFAQKYGGKN